MLECALNELCFFNIYFTGHHLFMKMLYISGFYFFDSFLNNTVNINAFNVEIFRFKTQDIWYSVKNVRQIFYVIISLRLIPERAS